MNVVVAAFTDPEVHRISVSTSPLIGRGDVSLHLEGSLAAHAGRSLTSAASRQSMHVYSPQIHPKWGAEAILTGSMGVQRG